MTRKRPIESYSDSLHVLNTTILHKGVRLPFPEARAAITMRHRLYRARKNYFETTDNPQYNDIYIQLIYDSGEVQGPGALLHPEAPCALVLRLHSEKPVPTITDLDGNIITSDLEDTLPGVRKNLGLE